MPPARLAAFSRDGWPLSPFCAVWTNEEGGEEGQITSVTFREKGGKTIVEVIDLYPTKEALDEALANGSTGALPLQFEQLDEILAEEG